MLTLKVYVDGEMRSIDSTRVVHGRFSFGGSMDSTMLANVFWGNLSLMPIVLEEGEVDLRISETQQSALVAGPTVTTGREQTAQSTFRIIRSQSTRRKAPKEEASLFFRPI